MRFTEDHSFALFGKVKTGIGQGAGFTGLEWARSQFVEHCGIDPHPGTLNVAVEDASHQESWKAIRGRHGLTVRAPTPDACDATLYPLSIGHTRNTGRGIVAAAVVPHVPGYADDQIEVIAAVNLREHFDLDDGAPLGLRVHQRQAIGAAIFDVDGTLLNSLDGYHVAASRATAEYGYTVSLDHVRRALNTNQPFWDFIIPEGEPRDDKRIGELREATMRHWPDALREVVRVLPGVGDALERLKSAGIRLAIYTGSGGESFPPLREAGLMELFEVIVTGNDVARRKPDPQGIVRCLAELGLRPDDAAYVGDSCIDVGASLGAGVMSIGVLTGAGDSASLSVAGADRIAAHVGGIPGLFELNQVS
ncbi:MAG: HAD-IA family hydrolase [Gammaproteobacteria bacterium]|nr:HAD-IA family hydrolase [Gammaproteobacteria bacterium]MBT8443565.1 HAD-IA family hydrolase [Gammaproteobacteria bacterium]